MKTVVIPEAGGYDKLIIKDAPKLAPTADEVVVETRASGINYADICVRWGIYESAKQYVGWPITPGFEFAGNVIAVGSNVTKHKVGDRVFGVTRFNGYSGCIKVNEKHLYPIPLDYTFEQMAAFPAVFLTAYHGLFQQFYNFEKMQILIHSAAGGVGGALLQLCKAKGYETIGIVGAAHKKAKAKEFGATHVISKQEDNWYEHVRIMKPDGVDIIFDANGVETLKQSFDILRPTGKLVIYGFHTMLPKKGGKINWPKLAFNYLKTPRFNPLDLTTHNKSLMAFNLSFLFERDDLFLPAMDELLLWLEQGKIRPHQITTYPLTDVAKAHADLESGQTTGKLVLIH
jgi:NADPH:quinone reductase-like Zn-dependent oxidoreductase